MKKITIVLFLIGLSITAIGLHGVYGFYQINYMPAHVSNAISWYVFGIGVYLLLLSIITFTSALAINENDILKSKLDKSNKSLDKYFDLYRQADILNTKYKATIYKYKDIDTDRRNELSTLKRQCNSKSANIVKLSNIIKRRNEEISVLKNMNINNNTTISILRSKIKSQ